MPIVDVHSEARLGLRKIFREVDLPTSTNDFFIAHVGIGKELGAQAMLDNVAIFVCCAMVKVAGLVFVQLFRVVEVKWEPVFAVF